LSVTGSNSKIVSCKKNEEMKSFINPSKIGQMPKSESKVRSTERIRTGTKRQNLRRLEDLSAETGPPLTSIQRIIL
jgi:hypothetical protein